MTRRVISRLLSGDPLDLDDLGAQAAEHLGAARSRLMATGEEQRLLRRRGYWDK
jgi:hypothetical protein